MARSRKALYQINRTFSTRLQSGPASEAPLRLPAKASLDKGSPTASTSAGLSAVLWRGASVGSKQILSYHLTNRAIYICEHST